MMGKCFWCGCRVQEQEVGVQVMDLSMHAWCAKELVVDTVRALRDELATVEAGARRG